MWQQTVNLDKVLFAVESVALELVPGKTNRKRKKRTGRNNAVKKKKKCFAQAK